MSTPTIPLVPVFSIRSEEAAPPARLSRLTERHLRRNLEFGGARVAGYTPCHAPDGSIAYYEAKIASDAVPDHGWIIVSTTERDFPIVEFATRGPTHWERLRSATGGEFRMVRYGPRYMAAEDAAGRLLAAIGTPPALVHRRRERVEEAGRSASSTTAATAASAAESYARLRTRYDAFLPRNRRAVEARWAAARYADTPTEEQEPAGEGYTSGTTSGGSALTLYTVPGFNPDSSTNNHTWFTQLPPNESPNTNDWYTGCGAEAWLNLYGWFDRNGVPSVLDGQPQTNNSYINNHTVALRDYLGTTEAWWVSGDNQGYTDPANMDQGIGYLYAKLKHEYSSVVREDWWYTDENWIYEGIRDAIINRKVPCVVGYYEDWHYAVAYAVKEPADWEEQDTYICVDVTDGESRYKWIPKETIFGVWVLSGVGPVRDPYFNRQASTTLAAPWYKTGQATAGVEISSSGEKNAILRTTASTPKEWSALYQEVRLAPNTSYRLTGSLRSSSVTDGYFSVRADSLTGPILNEVKFGSLASYQTLTVDFKTGTGTKYYLYAGFWSRSVDATMRLDNVRILKL